MTRPTTRILALLEILQSGGTRTVGDLARRLDVDERTVRRYVAHLDELGIPVWSVRGRYGGYRLAPGYRLPPLMFTSPVSIPANAETQEIDDDDPAVEEDPTSQEESEEIEGETNLVEADQ